MCMSLHVTAFWDWTNVMFRGCGGFCCCFFNSFSFCFVFNSFSFCFVLPVKLIGLVVLNKMGVGIQSLSIDF